MLSTPTFRRTRSLAPLLALAFLLAGLPTNTVEASRIPARIHTATSTLYGGASAVTFLTDQGTGAFGSNSIFKMNLDGSGAASFLPGVAQHAWSPDGTLVAYDSGNELTVADLHGNNARNLAPMDNSSAVGWSPDGGTDASGNRTGKLVFVDFDEVEVVNVDGTGLKSLWGRQEDGCMFQLVGTSFLDANNVIFSSALPADQCSTRDNSKTYPYGDPGGLFKESVNGGAPTRVSYSGQTHNDIAPFYPTVSPDGTQIAYNQREANGNYGIFLMPSGGGGGGLMTPSADTNDQVGGWSPDSQDFVFSHQTATGAAVEVSLASTSLLIPAPIVVSSTLPANWNNQLPEFVPITTPVATISDQTYTRPSAGFMTVNIPVTLSFRPKAEGTVQYSIGTQGDTAQEGVDYTASSGTLTFGASVVKQTIPVQISSSSTNLNKTFTITLSNPSKLVLGKATATITLTPVLSGYISDQTLFYPATNSRQANVPIMLNASPPAGTTVQISYAVSPGGNAVNGQDYSLTPSTVTFNPGDTVKNIPVTVFASGAGQTRTFDITISSPSGTQLGQSTATITLTEPSLSIADQTFYRPTSGTKQVDVPVTLSAAAQTPITVQYAAQDGTAVTGTDYDLSAGTLTYNAGDTFQTIHATIHAANTKEIKSFSITLTNPAGATLSRALAHIHINPSALVVNDPGDAAAVRPQDELCDTGAPPVNGQLDCTLRAAIQVLNANPGKFTFISFAMPNGGVIAPHAPLPSIAEPVTIDGTTQPSGRVEIDGSGVGQLGRGKGVLDLNAPTTLKGLAVYSAEVSQPDIQINSAASGSVIQGNHIGTDSSFASKENGLGIRVLGAQNVSIGGPGAGQGNIIGNTQGLGTNHGGSSLDDGIGIELVGANGTAIQGNFIGTSGPSGLSLPNTKAGILIQSSATTLVGGTAAGDQNVITSSFVGDGVHKGDGIRVQGSSSHVQIIGNQVGVIGLNPPLNQRIEGNGISISGALSTEIQDNTVTAANGSGIFLDVTAGLTTITGNRIGVDASGNAIPNGGDGILVNGATAVTIGGQSSPTSCLDPCNLIAGNGGAGIHLAGAGSTEVLGNFIGLQPDRSGGLPNGKAGILLDKATRDNQIGDLGPGDGNQIAFNAGPGVQVQAGSSNSILSNAIFHNAGQSSDPPGIALIGDAKGRALTPQLTSAMISSSSGKLEIKGNLTTVSGMYLIQVFFGDAFDSGASNFQQLLATQQIDASKGKAFLLALTPPSPAHGFVEVTVTSLDAHGSPLTTSQLSNSEHFP